jgi:hypothetical protein
MPVRFWRPALIIAFSVPLCVLVGGILVASGDRDVVSALRDIANDPWGLVTLIDLGVALVLVAAWIIVVEPRRWLAALLVLAVACLGNVTTLAYLIARTITAASPRDVFVRRADPTRPVG